MRGAGWLAATAIVIAITAFGCERERRRVPEPKMSEKTDLPAVNERIEREAEQGTRTGAPPAADQPGTETGRPPADQGKSP
jgi:hypothetical protein